VAIYLGEVNLWFLPLSILLVSSRQRALATILHEATHGALCNNKKLEKIIGTWCAGYTIFQTWGSYKLSHTLEHHHKLEDTNYDPNFKYYQESGVFNESSPLKFIFKYLISPIFFLSIFRSLKYLLINRLIRCNDKKELFFN